MAAEPGRPCASRDMTASTEVRPNRRACSNAVSRVSPSTKVAQSMRVRAAHVHGRPSTTMRSALGSAARCTATSGAEIPLHRSIVTSIQCGLGIASSRSSRAATRCEIAELSPAHSVTAIARCRAVTGAPAMRYTPGNTRIQRSVRNRRSIVDAGTSGATCARVTNPYCCSANSSTFIARLPPDMTLYEHKTGKNGGSNVKTSATRAFRRGGVSRPRRCPCCRRRACGAHEEAALLLLGAVVGRLVLLDDGGVRGEHVVDGLRDRALVARPARDPSPRRCRAATSLRATTRRARPWRWFARSCPRRPTRPAPPASRRRQHGGRETCLVQVREHLLAYPVHDVLRRRRR